MSEKKTEAIVLSNNDGDLFVVPVEYLNTSKVDPASRDIVLKSTTKSSQELKLTESLSFLGTITRSEGAEFPRSKGDTAWPHYVGIDE